MASGARLDPGVSLRRRPALTSWRVVAVCVVIALSLACDRSPQLPEGGLPPDLPRYLKQLRTLQVPPTVTHLDWLPSTLRELEAPNTEAKEIPIHPGLERLEIPGASALMRIPALPRSLRELDIRFTGFDGPGTIPEGLEHLALGGKNIRTLEGLREASLLELTLKGVPTLISSSGLPDSLQYLSISDATFTELKGLPSQLKELHLQNTNIRSLRDLPESLQSITLTGNAYMRMNDVELPPSLLSLTLDKSPPQANLAFLNRLELIAPVPIESIPPSVRDLQVPVLAMLPLMGGSPSVRRLGISADKSRVTHPDRSAFNGEAPFSRFPGLRELHWPGADDLGGLPPGLKSLDIRNSPLPGLVGLFGDVELESLDVSLTAMKIGELPRTLRHLRYRFCAFPVVKDLPPALLSLDIEGSRRVAVLLGIPSGLQSLDISETSISVLPQLPDTLLELDISNSRIQNLDELRDLVRLRKLTVHAGQLRSLSGLPSSVRELHFVEFKGGRL